MSRQTLTDIRQAVSGYRRATLAVEVASAYAALDAAGIKLDAAPAVAAATGEFDAAERSRTGLEPARGGDERDPPQRGGARARSR